MNDSQTLEMQIKTTGEQTLKVLNQINSTLTGMSTNLSKAGTSAKNIEKIGDLSSRASSKIDKLGNSFKRLFTFAGAKLVATKAMDFLDSAVNRAEELNLFNVIFKNIEKDGVKSFSTLGEEAMRFQNKLNEAFGTNKTETLRYQGLFQAMATNQGIDEKHAAIMSENMVKLTYDLASLYNRSEKTTAEALRAGVYAGMTKPLRGYGLDVTEKSLKNVLPALGITDRSISDMNQAEKEILRYISTLNQARSAMGDFAETIESPANQLKIFKQQLVEVKAAIGNLFMGLYAEILPYANAILMVIKEIAKAIANFFGIETQDYNTGIGSLEDTYEGFEDIGNGASKATKAAKELKRQVLGFDQINNLTTPSNAGSGGGSGSGGGLIGGIDKRLLDALSGYDNLMDKVKMKANEIRDRWMEILGFQKVLNPLTGEYEWKYQGLGTTVKNLWDQFVNLNPQVRLFVGALSLAAIGKIVSGISNLVKSLGGKGLAGILQDNVLFLKKIKNVGVEAWSQNATKGERFKTALEGIGIAAGGLALVKTGMDDIVQSGGNVLDVIEVLGGTTASVFGGIQAGAAIFGTTWGAAIGGVVGGISSLVTIIEGVIKANDELGKKVDETTELVTKKYDEWKDSMDRLQESYKIVDNEMSYYQKLYDELKNIVDENGKIKKGYEDRAKFITSTLSEALGVEIKVVGNTIQEYDKLKDKVQEAIDKEKARLKLVALEEKAKEAIKKESEARDTLKKAQDNLTEAQEKYNTLVAHGTVPLIARFSSHLDQAEENYNTAKKTLDGYTDTIREWEKATELSVTGNTEQLNWYFDHESKLYGKSKEEKLKYWGDLITDNEAYLKQLKQDQGKYSEEEYNAKKKQYEDQITLAKQQQSDLRLVMKTQTGLINDDTVKAWENMAKDSSDGFKKNFESLPKETQVMFISYFEKNKSKFSKDFQNVMKGVKANLTIDVNGNVTPITKAIKAMVKKFAPFISDSTVNSILRQFGLAELGGAYSNGTWKKIPQYANGGLPSHGTLFAAGENGAEIVGNINRRTEVLNRSQIASAIYSAVASAMSQYGGGTTQVELIAHTDEGVIIDRINQKTKQTGVCPINIPA